MIYEGVGNGNGSSSSTYEYTPPREGQQLPHRRRFIKTFLTRPIVLSVVVVVVMGVPFPLFKEAESFSFQSSSLLFRRRRRGAVQLAPGETNKKNHQRQRGRLLLPFVSDILFSQNSLGTTPKTQNGDDGDEERETSSSDSTTSSSSSTNTTTPRTRAFSSFQFAPNGVCIQPPYFEDITASSSSASSSSTSKSSFFTMRNVPGDGDCMFLAVALAAATSMGVGGNDALLRAISRETRHVVAQVLESPHGILYISSGSSHQDDGRNNYYQTCTARDLLRQATQQEGFGTNTTLYLQALRTEGRQGGLYGGGPELTVLANVLRRPISIYEIRAQVREDGDDDDDDDDDNMVCPIVCRGTFGDGLFEDPCLQLDHSAVLLPDEKPEGAYSWHLHILVVDVNDDGGEKHACVLLPASPPSTTTTTLKADLEN